MHTGIPMARAVGSNVPPYRLSEPQANHFASELLMPRQFMRPSDTPATVALRHAVSAEAAAIRINFMKTKAWSKN
ncbi:ImmA/IrrE family metallo-endopeptidase [Mesorhizobium australicum]